MLNIKETTHEIVFVNNLSIVLPNFHGIYIYSKVKSARVDLIYEND